MREIAIAHSANEAWKKLLENILANGAQHSPRGQQTTEILASQSALDMRYPVVSLRSRISGGGQNFFGFMMAEAAWILSGDNRVCSIQPWSRVIHRFSDDGHFFHGAYGPKLIDQVTYVCDSLLADRDTRQGVANIWRENPRVSKDVPCTLSAQWLIRDNKLCCIDTMRSSDAWLGWPFDVFNFTMFTCYIALLMRERDPAATSQLSLGNLYLTAGSQHVYARNLQQVQDCFGATEHVSFAPIDPFVFNSPQDLVDHLWSLAYCLLKPAFIQHPRPRHRFLAEVLEGG